MIEEWLPVKGYEGLYEVSNLGKIKEIERGIDMKYEYLISYNFKGGVGSVCLTVDVKIDKIEKITEIVKYIEKEYELKNVAINSYQLIRKYNIERK